MSINYYVTEHFTTTKSAGAFDVHNMVCNHLFDLGNSVLRNDCRLSITIAINDEVFSFSGYKVTPEVQDMFNKVSEVFYDDSEDCKLDIKLNYELCGFDSTFSYWDLIKAFDEIVQKDRAALSGFFYSSSITPDCGDGLFELSAYGFHNGVLYEGEVPAYECEFPDDGDWITNESAVTFGPDEPELVTDIAKAKEACQSLATLVTTQESDDVKDYLETFEKDVFFQMHYPRIQSRADFETLIYNNIVLLNVAEKCDTGVWMWQEFADYSKDDVRLLNVDFDKDGIHSVKIREIR